MVGRNRRQADQANRPAPFWEFRPLQRRWGDLASPGYGHGWPLVTGTVYYNLPIVGQFQWLSPVAYLDRVPYCSRVATLLGGAPVIESEGRAFAVETRYAGRDERPIEPQMADIIARAMRAEAGSLLAFLPGVAEIRRTRTQLEGRTDAATDVVTLYGAMAGDEQDRAIAPAPPGRRKIVLATALAETSITIEGVRIVVDSGLARVPRCRARCRRHAA